MIRVIPAQIAGGIFPQANNNAQFQKINPYVTPIETYLSIAGRLPPSSTISSPSYSLDVSPITLTELSKSSRTRLKVLPYSMMIDEKLRKAIAMSAKGIELGIKLYVAVLKRDLGPSFLLLFSNRYGVIKIVESGTKGLGSKVAGLAL